MSPSKFAPGSYVWAKCGSHFWPAEVVDFDGLPADIKEDFPDKKKPQYVVKFFDEDGYEFLKNDKNLHPYNCDKKEEFIKKGIIKSRSQSKEGANGWFAKFPQDVIRCEKLTGGDQKILDKEPFKETPSKAVNYKEIFVDPEAEDKSTAATKRKSTSNTPNGSPKKKSKASDSRPSRPISHPRFKPGGEQHQVRIMQQPSTPYHLDLQKKEESKSNSANNYTCHICGFSASRLNVIILHNKSHSEPSNNGSSSASKAKGRAASVSTPKGGRKKAAEKSSPAAVKSRAKKTETPKKAVAASNKTPKAEKATNGRGSKRSAEKVEDTPKSTEKKPRMTKKKKEEMAKKEQEKKLQKKKILGDWDEEEDGEAEKEEKKKIKANIEGAEDSDMSDAESDQEAYFQDDNIQGNVYGDEDDEELFQDPEPVKSPPKKQDKVETEKKEAASTEAATDDALACVAKVLEETKVPEIDTSAITEVSKKSVKFSEQVAKEIAITKMALVQPKSNMAGPMEVEDEFAEGDEDLEPKASTAKKILKKRSLSPPPPPRPQDSDDDEEDPTTTAEEIEKVTSTEAEEEAPKVQESIPEAETESNPTVTSTETPEAAVTTSSVDDDNSEKTAAESMLELGATSSSEAPAASAASSKDTYLLVVDDSNQLDQLNDSQTFYIDSNSLANGDLSNMVLATDQATNGQAEQEPAAEATEASS